jgi:hypothetical protein
VSTGAECRFTEVEPGRWSYWLQDWPYGDWPDGSTYGPFGSFAKAEKHLSENHANPGGYSLKCLTEEQGHVHEAWPFEMLYGSPADKCASCGKSITG